MGEQLLWKISSVEGILCTFEMLYLLQCRMFLDPDYGWGILGVTRWVLMASQGLHSIRKNVWSGHMGLTSCLGDQMWQSVMVNSAISDRVESQNKPWLAWREKNLEISIYFDFYCSLFCCPHPASLMARIIFALIPDRNKWIIVGSVV